MQSNTKSAAFVASALTVLSSVSHAATIGSGSATMTLTEAVGGNGSPVGFFNAYFNATTPFATASATPAPGNEPFTRLTGTPGTIGTASAQGIPGTPGTVRVVDPVRGAGATVPVVGGRNPQISTLDVDLTSPASVLSSWSASSSDFGGLYVGATSLGEQIAFTNQQRWGGTFNGALYYSDLALVNEPSRAGSPATGGTLSGLVLRVNDAGFAGAVYADIGNVVITPVAGTLSITGDLLIGAGLGAFGAPVGTDFGDFSLVVATSQVPEPTMLAALAGAGLLALRRRR